MYGDLVRDSLSLCASTLRVVLGSSRGWPTRPGPCGFVLVAMLCMCAMTCQCACVVELLTPDTVKASCDE